MTAPRPRRARKPPPIVLVEGEAVDSPRERDQTVERLLRQSLGTPQRGGVTDACLDAETLAAWTAGGLTGLALEAVQLHVADCARCQSMAGTLARISSTVPQAEPVPPSRRWLAWFFPLTAAATAVALWFAVPGNPGAPPTVASRAPISEAPASDSFASRNPPPTAAREPTQVPSAERQAKESAAPAQAPAAELRREGPRSNTLDQPAAVGSVANQEAAGRDLARDKVEAFQPPAAPAAAAAAAPQSAPSNQRADSARSALRATAVAAPDIVSPDPAVRWRILGAAVQHSSNGGSTWETVPIGVTAELTAGVAPATTVCWLVGRSGVVLLTTDGQTWRRLPFPEITDLSAVRTVDAGGHVASVSTADGRTFVTTDAGATWSAR
jgi:hypothetical protein